ncbi:hypothetical protein [Bradyrhizobium elkanii]|uniref:hypothetical protein n=1 Tax=Bradyrhizobium elkanii TaxID=29448 RepID=UPI0008417F84|nr:hypothetical protein [Bradyrhizobium elkanii]ODM71737.1 hypothetical protein A6X20_07285 [Bradyrhizobium elkanii]ODM79110.1 hypothetical protein A6452_28870 [Bradyrhizobium elkanii]
MSLSDACFEFVETMRDAGSDTARQVAVVELLTEVARYACSPFRYGDELLLLAAGCREYLDPTPSSADRVQRIVFLADSVRELLDTPPCTKVPLS